MSGGVIHDRRRWAAQGQRDGKSWVGPQVQARLDLAGQFVRQQQDPAAMERQPIALLPRTTLWSRQG
jgi:hypothetical protein